jgi:hypothetical protein
MYAVNSDSEPFHMMKISMNRFLVKVDAWVSGKHKVCAQGFDVTRAEPECNISPRAT